MSTHLRALLPVVALVLAACAQNPSVRPIGFPPQGLASSDDELAASLGAQIAQQAEDEESLEERARKIFTAKQPPAANLPDAALSQDLLFKFLLSEIASQRGNLQMAAQGYLELAKSTRDPRVARRAAELATYARLQNTALDAARLWYELDKANPQARQTLVGLLLSGNKLQEAKPHLKALIDADGNPAQGLLQLHTMLSKHPDKEAVFGAVKELTQDYKQMPEAHFALSQSAFAAGKVDVATAEANEALRLRPDWELGALLKAQLIQQRESPQKAADYLRDFLQAHPKANDVRANYARLLIGNKQLKEAREEYARMQTVDPANADIAVTAGLLSLQLGDFDAAEVQLKRALELNYRDPDTLRFYLGQTFEERKQLDAAMKWYGEVKGGDQFISARARYAFLLARQNKVAEARKYLQSVEVASDEQRTMLIQAEAQVLREGKAYNESYELLAGAVEKQPESIDLLYDAALAAEKIDKLDVVEHNLRKVIKLKPDHAQAYNALGYTLGDRTDRFAEAKQYVEKALELSPDDPFIMDSVGWVYFKMGNHEGGLDYLQRAFKRRPDPEIAAHLGEVLWAKGNRADAETLWRDALKSHPDNDVLRDTVKRFLP